MTSDLLGIYLNDHLMGATGGLELFRRASHSQRSRPWGPALARLTNEVSQCRDELKDIMTAAGAPQRSYKVLGGWLGEKVGRAKLNGYLLGRSPLSDLVELELLRLGVEGQASMWRVLVDLPADDERLDRARLRSLLARAEGFAEELEGYRLRAAHAALAAR